MQVLLSEKTQHRTVGILDLLTAAVAEHHDAALIHYHPAFELISSITGQPQLWVATRGSLEAEDEGQRLPATPRRLQRRRRESPPAPARRCRTRWTTRSVSGPSPDRRPAARPLHLRHLGSVLPR